MSTKRSPPKSTIPEGLERLDVHVPKGTKARLTKIAKSKHMTMSAYVRRVLLGMERVEPEPEPASLTDSE